MQRTRANSCSQPSNSFFKRWMGVLMPRAAPQPHCPSLRTLRAPPPPTLPRCHARQRNLRRPTIPAFSFYNITPFTGNFSGGFVVPFWRNLSGLSTHLLLCVTAFCPCFSGVAWLWALLRLVLDPHRLLFASIYPSCSPDYRHQRCCLRPECHFHLLWLCGRFALHCEQSSSP